MWLFTTDGFYSAVCARQGDGKKNRPVDPDRMMVRARVREHLANLIKRFPDELQGAEILKSAGTDYAYRLFVLKSVWAVILAKLAEETDYDNFKSAVERQQGSSGNAYLGALHEVWGVMHSLQSE
jgi:hypothetical protein